MDWALSRVDRNELRERMQTTVDAQECRRCGALLMLDDGASVADTAYEYGVTRQTLYNWFARLRSSSHLQFEGSAPLWTANRVDR